MSCTPQRRPARTYVLSDFDGYDLADEPSRKFKDANRTPSKTLMFYKKVDGVCYVVPAVGQQNKYKKIWVESACFDDGTASKIAQKNRGNYVEPPSNNAGGNVPNVTTSFPSVIVYPKRLGK